MSKQLETFARAHFIDASFNEQAWLAKRNDGAKLFMMILFLLVIASVGKYDVLRLVPLILLPAWIGFELEFTKGALIKRLMLLEPMFLVVALLSPFLTQETIQLHGMTISKGWLIFLSLAIKSTLTLSVVLQVGMMMGIEGLCKGLRVLKVPSVFIDLTALTYRYLFVLVEEGLSLSRAYKLRAPHLQGVHFRTWGSFAGQLILRSLDRAERIDRAMKMRGLNGARNQSNTHFDFGDWVLVVGMLVYAAAVLLI